MHWTSLNTNTHRTSTDLFRWDPYVVPWAHENCCCKSMSQFWCPKVLGVLPCPTWVSKVTCEGHTLLIWALWKREHPSHLEVLWTRAFWTLQLQTACLRSRCWEWFHRGRGSWVIQELSKMFVVELGVVWWFALICLLGLFWVLGAKTPWEGFRFWELYCTCCSLNRFYYMFNRFKISMFIGFVTLVSSTEVVISG